MNDNDFKENTKNLDRRIYYEMVMYHVLGLFSLSSLVSIPFSNSLEERIVYIGLAIVSGFMAIKKFNYSSQRLEHFSSYHSNLIKAFKEIDLSKL